MDSLQDLDYSIYSVSRDSDDGQFDEIASLCREHAGKLLVAKRLLISISFFGEILIAKVGGAVVGALTVTYPTVPEIFSFNSHLPADEQLDPAVPTYELCDLVVHEEYRRQGIGSCLVRATRNTLWYGEPIRQFQRGITTSRVPTDGSGPVTIQA